MGRKTIVVIVFLFFMQAPAFAGAGNGAFSPGEKDKCPVCGMFVHKYPDWTAQLIFLDGSTFYFDGVKDLLKYMFDLEKYNPGKQVSQIQHIRVTGYYDMVIIDGRTAHYVVGSDVYGPMGRELIPFATAEAADEFRRDHGGTDVFTFDRITPDVVERLD